MVRYTARGNEVRAEMQVLKKCNRGVMPELLAEGIYENESYGNYSCGTLHY